MPAFGKKIYIKDYSRDPIYTSVNRRFWAKSKILPATLMIVGIVVLVSQVVVPLVYFKTVDVTQDPKQQGTVLGTATGFTDFTFNELKKDPADNKVQVFLNHQEIPKYFYVSVPKLGIKNAVVETNSESLNPDKSLGHYKGSGLPGEIGNAFIYGHSVLPFFYNPNNYKTIFSTLNKLRIGDTIYINYQDKTYVYIVENRLIIDPTKVEPLAEFKPKYLGESTLTLMTCDPPGTREKRLLINAVLSRE